MTSKKKAWILASRPKTLPASLGPVLLGASIAGSSAITSKLSIFLLTILCALLLQIGTNLVNDYFDSVKGLDGENRLGPDRALQKGWLTREELKKGIIFVFTLAFTLGLALMWSGGMPIVIIGLFSMAMAFMYTGGPFPLSYFALGEVLALICFGPIPVWGTYFLLTGEYSSFPILVGLIPGLISLSLMGINNLRDNKNDSEKGKKTLATIFGETFGRTIILLGIMGSMIIPACLYFDTKAYAFIGASLVALVFQKTWRNIAFGEVNEKLNTNLATTGKYLFLNCLICSIGFFSL